MSNRTACADDDHRLPAARSTKGWRSVSLSGATLVVCFVVGSLSGAPWYRKIAELIPFAKSVSTASLGLARIQ